jgi:hydroxyacylglutathione hydrolase
MHSPAATPLTSNILRLRAANPSAMTGSGTNSYLVFGPGGSAVLIDAGPDLADHFAAILQVLAGAKLAAIFITHPHLDHSGLAPRLAAQTGAQLASFGAATLHGLGCEGTDAAHEPDLILRAGRVQIAGIDLDILHTPGHMQGHLCFGHGDILFSGDHVMGWSSSLISPPQGDMAAYRASLQLLQGAGFRNYFPGHGEVIDNPETRLAELLTHRAAREAQIMAALLHGPADARSLARQIYIDISPSLLPAAAHNVLAHLIELEHKGRAQPHLQGPSASLETPFHAVVPCP